MHCDIVFGAVAFFDALASVLAVVRAIRRTFAADYAFMIATVRAFAFFDALVALIARCHAFAAIGANVFAVVGSAFIRACGIIAIGVEAFAAMSADMSARMRAFGKSRVTDYGEFETVDVAVFTGYFDDEHVVALGQLYYTDPRPMPLPVLTE